LQEEEKLVFVHPFDDPYVIAGQGTIGMEILKQSVGRPLDVIFVCCGGGGLLAGVAAYVKVRSAMTENAASCYAICNSLNICLYSAFGLT
jgi:threonine dehydratase